MRDKITKRAVDALRPASDGSEAVIWDTEVKGFGVRAQRGGSKSYIVHYRAGIGRGAPLRKLEASGFVIRSARSALGGGDARSGGIFRC